MLSPMLMKTASRLELENFEFELHPILSQLDSFTSLYEYVGDNLTLLAHKFEL